MHRKREDKKGRMKKGTQKSLSWERTETLFSRNKPFPIRVVTGSLHLTASHMHKSKCILSTLFFKNTANLLSNVRNDVGRSRILQTCSATCAMMLGDQEYYKLVQQCAQWCWEIKNTQTCSAPCAMMLGDREYCKLAQQRAQWCGEIENTANLQWCWETALKMLPVTGENFSKTANTRNEARLDIRSRRFWVKGQQAFFDIKVFDPNAKRYLNSALPQCYA